MLDPTIHVPGMFKILIYYLYIAQPNQQKISGHNSLIGDERYQSHKNSNGFHQQLETTVRCNSRELAALRNHESIANMKICFLCLCIVGDNPHDHDGLPCCAVQTLSSLCMAQKLQCDTASA